MNKVLLLALGLLFFGCDKASRNNEHSGNTTAGVHNTTSENHAAGNVQEGSGTEISPQLEGVKDSASRLEVEEVHSAEEERDAQRNR